MRLSQKKIHDLATQIVAAMEKHPKVHLGAAPDALRVAVGSVILDDLEEEAEIDAEVDDLMAKHARDIQKSDLDANALRHKFKTEIARQRGFTL